MTLAKSILITSGLAIGAVLALAWELLRAAWEVLIVGKHRGPF